MKTMLAQISKAQRGTVALAKLCAVIAALASVSLLAISGQFLAGAGLAGAAGLIAAQGFNYLLPSAFIRAAAIARTACRYGERILGHRFALFAMADLRSGLFHRVAVAVLAGKAAGRSGDFAARMGQDVDALEDDQVRRVASAGAMTAGVAGVLAALVLGWLAGLIMVLGMTAMVLSARWLAQRQLPKAHAQMAQALANLKADYADCAIPVADIAVYGLAPALGKALAPAQEAFAHARAAVTLAEARIGALQTVIAALTVAALMLTGHGTAPTLAIGMLGSLAALEIWSTLSASALRAPQLALAEARLEALPDGHAVVRPLPAIPALTIAGRDFAAGSRIRIAGRSGAGKTRLVETLVGLRTDAPQSLAVAGQDPRSLGLASLRHSFALATQDAPLIAGTVADNLMLARAGLTESELWAALEVACAADVVRSLPDGLNQWLGGDGARLSGGQRRRIVLARALLADRPWLVLDEPSEGLDDKTEAQLVLHLDRWLTEHNQGLLLVSHRSAMAALAKEHLTVVALSACA